MRRAIIHLPLPGKIAAAYRQGHNTTPHNRSGAITWAAWLQAKYGQKKTGSPERIITEGRS